MAPAGIALTARPRGGMRRHRDWSKLPSELLELISDRLTDIADFARFRAVCNPWRSAANPTHLPPQLPWLLLDFDADDSIRRFFSISTRKTYTFDIPSSRGCTIYTSPNGFLLIADESLSISLLNPLTGSHIHLPPYPDTDKMINHYRRFSARMINHYGSFSAVDRSSQVFFMPIVFRCYPFVSAAGETIVALVIVRSSQFLYCRVAQDSVWIKPDKATGSPIDAVTYHKGKFYIIHENKKVATCELGDGAKPVLVPSLTVPVTFSCCYLTVLAGELLLVISKYNNAEEREHFTYFKLDETGEIKWSRIEGIGGHAMFLAAAENLIVIDVVRHNVSGCRSNSIYNNISYKHPWSFTSPFHQLDVIRVEDGSVELMPLFEEEYRSDLHRATWFTPSLC